MNFGKDSYKSGALERLRDAQVLKESKRFCATVYIAGRAVEAMFRAYYWKTKSNLLNTGHSIKDLAKECGIYDYVGKKGQQKMAASIQTLIRLWENDLRYASNTKLCDKVRKYSSYQGKDNDVAFMVARDALEAATGILTTGVAVWNKKPCVFNSNNQNKFSLDDISNNFPTN